MMTMYLPEINEFRPFSLSRLLATCFGNADKLLKPCILIDLPDPSLVRDFEFLQHDRFSVQRHAVESFYKPLNSGVGQELNYDNCEFFAFHSTGGSNLDPEGNLLSPLGESIEFESDLCPGFDLIFALTDFSLTAPLTAMAKRHGFRGATLHGVNDVILNSGLSVDYLKVSRQAELYRQTLDHADSFSLSFSCFEKNYRLRLDCSGQTAQKSHGLCPPGVPDIANLPAGEVYFVPTGASGSFPFRFKDGTVGEMLVEDGAITEARLITGEQNLIDARNDQLKSDPATGIIGELGFGTQILPFSGRDIQDEKILGTCHIATGRSDHLGGNLTPDLFNSRKNASHDDILYAPPKTPEISVSEVRMFRDGQEFVILEDFNPSEYLLENLAPEYPTEILVGALDR